MIDNSDIVLLAEAQPKGKRKKAPPLLAAVQLMRKDEAWQGVFAYDDFAKRDIVRRAIPGAAKRRNEFPHDLTDTDVTDATLWLQAVGVPISTRTAGEAIHAVAADSAFHPVRDYLHRLEWDGVPRIDTWLVDHLGASDTAFNRAAGAKWLIGAVARAERPGCAMKTVLVIEGPQDLGKSTVFATLAVEDRFFTDHISNLNKKDALEEVQGKWIIEFAEFDTLGRAEANRVKAFISTRTDHFRPSYARIAEDFPRQWVGVATVNPGGTGYLRDETGGVRFWPVACAVGWRAGRAVDFDRLRSTRDQFWAEALVRFRCDEPWWITDEAVRAEQVEAAAARAEDDPREPAVRTAVEGQRWVQMADVLLEIGYQVERHDKSLQTQIGGLLTRLGWIRHRCQGVMGPNGPGYYYFPPGTNNPTEYARLVTREADEIAKPYASDALKIGRNRFD